MNNTEKSINLYLKIIFFFGVIQIFGDVFYLIYKSPWKMSSTALMGLVGLSTFYLILFSPGLFFFLKKLNVFSGIFKQFIIIGINAIFIVISLIEVIADMTSQNPYHEEHWGFGWQAGGLLCAIALSCPMLIYQLNIIKTSLTNKEYWNFLGRVFMGGLNFLILSLCTLIFIEEWILRFLPTLPQFIK